MRLYVWFSKAGAILKIAPSSVARNIDGLEKEIGFTLFKRSTRQLSLTEENSKYPTAIRAFINFLVEKTHSK